MISTIIVNGQSMSPFLYEGEQIQVEWNSCFQKDYKLGDVVVIRIGKQQWIVHRIVKKVGHSFLVKGDYSFSYDRIEKSAIWGKVVYSHSFLDRIIAYLSRSTIREFRFSNFFARRLIFLMATVKRHSFL